MKKIVKVLSLIGLSVFVAASAQSQDVNNSRGYVQVFDIASESNLSLNEYKQYHFENDMVDVSYLFWSSYGKMQVKVENKAQTPLYVNWSKSTFTVEGVEIPMTPDESKLTDAQYKIYQKYKASEPTLTDMDYEWQKITMGREEKKDEISEVLSKSTYTKGNYYLMPRERNTDAGVVLDTAVASYVEKHNSVKKQNATIYKKEYSKDNSPLVFTCKLVVSTDKNFSTSTEIVEKFYISSVREMDAKHFRGKRIGQTPEGYGVYKFPERKSTAFYVEINPRNSVEFNKRFAR
ncbi:MAG: hypothetical protein IKO90_01495 [Bacteroidales bacterium]|nr:hypothetical protein [Bacteroidales bacterium]MBR4498189.1 hypothetical protein [Bacteroidales bacterium]MBR4689118.1 hypothetical protein [Bacteroidales bacterium]